MKGDGLLFEVGRLSSPHDCDPNTTEYSQAVFQNKIFFERASFPTIGEVMKVDLTEQQKEGLPKLKVGNKRDFEKCKRKLRCLEIWN